MAESQSRFALRADNAQYDSAMRKSESETRKLGKSQSDLGSTAGKASSGFNQFAASVEKGRATLNRYGIAATAAGVALGTAVIKNGLSSVDALAKQADALGVSTEKLAGLRHAAELTGAGTAAMDKGLEKLSIRMSEAAAGSGTAAKGFDALGIKAGDLVKLKPDEAMYQVADALSHVENSAQKTKIAYDIFGRSGTSLINTFSKGSDGLRVYQAEAEAAGVAISRIDAAKVEAANDAMFKVGEQAKGFGQQLSAKFAPVLNDVAKRIFNIGKESGGMATAAGKAFDYIVKAAGIFANGIRVIEIAWEGLKLGFQAYYQFVVSGLDKLSKVAVDVYNSLPWRHDKLEYTTFFTGFLDTMESEIAASKARIEELVTAKLPSTAFKEYVDDTERAFTAQAEAAVAAQETTQTAIIKTEDVTKAYGTASKETAKEVESAWDKAQQGMVERIDSNFSSAWRAALDGDKDYFKEEFLGSMLDAAKQFAAELLNLNVTRPLVQNVAGLFGMGGGVASTAATFSGGGTAGALGNLGSLFSSGSSLYSGLSNFGGSIFGSVGGAYGTAASGLNSLATYLGPNTYLGNIAGNASLNAQVLSNNYTYGSVGSNLAAGAANFGAGIVGSYAGQAVFGGDTTGIGAGVGGAVGSIWGPVGTAIGSFIGEGLETGLGNVLGFGGHGNNSAIANIAGGVSTAAGVGKNYSEKNLEAVTQIGDAVANFAALVGNDTYTAKLRVGNTAGLKLDGQKYKDVDSLLSTAFDAIISGADKLEPAVKKILKSFEGTPEQLGQFATSIVSISGMLASNPVDQAVQDLATADKAASQTILEAHRSQIDSLYQLAASYDGSVSGAQQLNVALAQNQKASYDLVTAYHNVSSQLSNVLTNTAQDIRQSVLTDAERIQAAKDERNRLRAEVGHETDQQQHQQDVLRINELTKQIFDSLSEEQQKLRAPDFAAYLDKLDAVQERQIERGIEEERRRQEELARTLQDALQKPADQFGGDVENLSAALEEFIRGLSSGNATLQRVN